MTPLSDRILSPLYLAWLVALLGMWSCAWERGVYPWPVGAIILVDVDQDGTYYDMMRTIKAGRQTHLFAHFGLGLGLGPNVNKVDVRVWFVDGVCVDMKDVDVDLYHSQTLKVYHP